MTGTLSGAMRTITKMPLTIPLTMRFQMPWRLRKLGSDGLALARLARNRLLHAAGRRRDDRPSIEFNIPFYGYTGGSYAIVVVANMLSRSFNVSFYTTPTNVLNRYLADQVRMVTAPSMDCDIYVMEAGSDARLMQRIAARGARLVISCHGFPSDGDVSLKNHGYSDSEVYEAFQIASNSHFVTEAQLVAFWQHGANPPDPRVISNGVDQVVKIGRTRSVGIVGDAALPLKNVARAVAAAEASLAEEVHVWGRFSETFGSRRAIWHGFESDKNKLFSSFDVLVSLSFNETQPLIVLEAMSAGIPCVLSNLSCYAEIRGLAGVWFVDPSDVAGATAAINDALDIPAPVRDGLRAVWERVYSPNVVERKWVEYINELIGRT